MMATSIVQPIDLVKTRMQLTKTSQSVSPIQVTKDIIKVDGVPGLYKGLTAALFRQITYASTRLGVYNALMERGTVTDSITGKKIQPSFGGKLMIGSISGCIGALAGNPAEISLIRMTSGKDYGYRNIFDALIKISRDEGLKTLWRGATPTVIRAVVLNAAQLGVYSQAKEMLLNYRLMQDGIGCHITSSMISGMAATIVSIPVDMAKTRLQSMKVDPLTGKPEYKNALDVLTKVVNQEGFFKLWKGFWPYYFKLGPHTILTFVFLEQFRLAFGNLKK